MEDHSPKDVTASGETPERRSSTIPLILKLWPAKVDRLGEDISFLQLLRNPFLTGRWKELLGAIEEKRGRLIGMPSFTWRWLRRVATGQSSLSWAVRTMRPPFSLEDLDHRRSSEMEVSMLELKLGFACEYLVTWNLASKDE